MRSFEGREAGTARAEGHAKSCERSAADRVPRDYTYFCDEVSWADRGVSELKRTILHSSTASMVSGGPTFQPSRFRSTEPPRSWKARYRAGLRFVKCACMSANLEDLQKSLGTRAYQLRCSLTFPTTSNTRQR